MSFNMRDYVSDDHIESIEEIAKSQSAIIQALSLENSKLENQLQQKENIINELDQVIIEFKKQIEEERKNYREIISNFVDKVKELKGSEKK